RPTRRRRPVRPVQPAPRHRRRSDSASSATTRAPGIASRGPRRWSGAQCLNASFTFSPACLRSDLAWSPLPSASRLLSSLALPVASLPLPLRSSAVFLNLSSSPMTPAFLSTLLSLHANTDGARAHLGGVGSGVQDRP